MFDFSAEARADVQLTDTFTLSDVLGISDFGRPSEHEQRQLLRGTFEACVRRRARRAASCIIPTRKGPGLKVQRETPDGWEEVEPDHPWLQLLRNPNDHRSPYVYWKWVFMARDLQGRAPQLVQDGPRGMPEQLLEMFAEFGYVEPIASRDGGVSGYVYERQDGADIRLQPRDVMELKRTDPHSPYETQSLLEALALEVSGDKFATEYRRHTFEEGRPPAVALQTEQNMPPDQAREHGETFKRRFMNRRGNVKGIPVLPGGMELNSISLDPEQMQMLDAQGLDQKVIFRVCGVPQALLDMDSNRAESEEARQEFMRGTIQPLIDETAAQLTLGLEQAFEPEANLRVVAPDVTPVDKKEQSIIDQRNTRNGIVTINDVRRRKGKDPYDVEVADEPLIPKSVVPLSMLEQVNLGGAGGASWESDPETERDPHDPDESAGHFM